MEVHSVKKSYGLFFFFSIFLKKIKVDKGLVKFFKFLSLYFSLSLCFEGLMHPCGCKLPLFPPIFLGAAVYVIIYVFTSLARAPKEVHPLFKVVESERVFSLKWYLLLIISLLFTFLSKDRRSGLCVEEFWSSGYKQR